MPLRHTLPALACVLGLPSPVLAQQAATDLDQVVVTATRTPATLADAIAPTQVIDRAEIERSQARDLTDLLRGRAGIDVANQGGAGKLSTVFMRGTESDHVLVLVDGVRIGSATAGLAAFQDLPVDQIERIEIVRGPRSSLYGSEAIGGVIQVFTRRDGAGIASRARIGAGSHDLREASAGIGGTLGRGWFGIDGAYQRTDGINACRGDGMLFRGCFTDEPDRDGYRNRSLNLRGGARLTDTLTLEGHALRAEASNEYDGSIFGGNEAENVQQVAGGKLAFAPSQAFTLTLQAGRAYDRSDAYFNANDGTPRSYVGAFDTRRDTASAQADIGLSADHVLSLGADWQRDAVESDTAYAVTDRDNVAGFAQYQGRFGAHRVQASLRRDDNEQFGNATTGGLGWGMDLSQGLALRASYGTGFKAPTFNDLYFPFGSGNPDLDPERSKSANVGIVQSQGAWRWSLDAYETRIDDLIALDTFFVPQNIARARIRGAEFTAGTALAGWDLSTQLAYTDPRNHSAGANHGNLLPRRARATGRIDADRAFGDLRLGVTARGAGSRYDNAANTARLGGYGTLDLRAAWAFHADWSLEARATNVLDKRYETVEYYNQPGREYGVAVRWAPKGE